MGPLSDLDGRRVLVTGASSGIGAAIAVGFAGVGARVAIHFNSNEAGVNEVADRCRDAGAPDVVVLQGDFRESATPARVVREAIEQLGGLDVLVNNAGDLVGRAPLDEVTDETIAAILQLNYVSLITASREALPALRETRGTMINVTSVAARTGGGGNSTLYAGAKGAVSAFTRAIAKDLAPEGIRVNALSPGVITTPFHDRHTDASGIADRIRRIPMGRIGDPEECVGTVLYLASPAASGYVTGQVIEVNGGMFMP